MSTTAEERPPWLAWFLAGLVVHDFLLAPAVLAVGLGVRRLVPAAARAAVQTGLLVSAVLVLVCVPVARGYGRASQPGNPSVLPLDYATNLLGVLAAVWLAVAVVVTLRRRGS